MASGIKVKCVCRIRPLIDREKDDSKCVSVVTPHKTLKVAPVDPDDKPELHSFNYVASEFVAQKAFFHTVGRPVAEKCIAGCNGAILCYGEAGAGKTHTVFGTPTVRPGPWDRGLVPRMLELIWSHYVRLQREGRQARTVRHELKCSIVEIYQEKIYDLLQAPETEGWTESLQLREDISNGVYVQGAEEKVIESCRDIKYMLALAYRNRRAAGKTIHRAPNRSHFVFQLYVDCIEAAGEDEGETTSRAGTEGNTLIGDISREESRRRVSKLCVIDLAGTNVSAASSVKGAPLTSRRSQPRLEESIVISQSLAALGDFIRSLSYSSVSTSGAYMKSADHTITHMLQDTLTPESAKNCILIAAVSPSSISRQETLRSIMYVQRAVGRVKSSRIRSDSVVSETEPPCESLQLEGRTLKHCLSSMSVMTVDRPLGSSDNEKDDTSEDIDNSMTSSESSPVSEQTADPSAELDIDAQVYSREAVSHPRSPETTRKGRFSGSLARIFSSEVNGQDANTTRETREDDREEIVSFFTPPAIQERPSITQHEVDTMIVSLAGESDRNETDTQPQIPTKSVDEEIKVEGDIGSGDGGGDEAASASYADLAYQLKEVVESNIRLQKEVNYLRDLDVIKSRRITDLEREVEELRKTHGSNAHRVGSPCVSSPPISVSGVPPRVHPHSIYTPYSKSLDDDLDEIPSQMDSESPQQSKMPLTGVKDNLSRRYSTGILPSEGGITTIHSPRPRFSVSAASGYFDTGEMGTQALSNFQRRRSTGGLQSASALIMQSPLGSPIATESPQVRSTRRTSLTSRLLFPGRSGSFDFAHADFLSDTSDGKVGMHTPIQRRKSLGNSSPKSQQALDIKPLRKVVQKSNSMRQSSDGITRRQSLPSRDYIRRQSSSFAFAKDDMFLNSMEGSDDADSKCSIS